MGTITPTQRKLHAPTDFPKGWTWAQHRLHGMIGGNDYQTPPGTAIAAPFAGKVALESGEISLRHRSGWSVVFLEAADALVGQRGVKQGEALLVTGRKWLHLHGLTPTGKRVPWATARKAIAKYEAAH